MPGRKSECQLAPLHTSSLFHLIATGWRWVWKLNFCWVPIKLGIGRSGGQRKWGAIVHHFIPSHYCLVKIEEAQLLPLVPADRGQEERRVLTSNSLNHFFLPLSCGWELESQLFAWSCWYHPNDGTGVLLAITVWPHGHQFDGGFRMLSLVEEWKFNVLLSPTDTVVEFFHWYLVGVGWILSKFSCSATLLFFQFYGCIFGGTCWQFQL